MSVAWFTELYRLNEAGRFADALRKSDRYLGQRPRDYALHLQRARALVGLGQLGEAEVHLDAAVTHSEGLAAWPYFYRATLHALAGRATRARADLKRAVLLDPRLVAVAAAHETLGRLRVKVAPAPAPSPSPSPARRGARPRPSGAAEEPRPRRAGPRREARHAREQPPAGKRAR